MQLSDDTKAVLEHLDEIVEGGLRKRGDIGALLEIGASNNEFEIFNDMTRTGKGMWNVYRTLRRVQPGQEGFPQLEREFANQMNTLREQIAVMGKYMDDETLHRFDEIYLGMTSGVIRNLVDLAHDLARFKDLQQEH